MACDIPFDLDHPWFLSDVILLAEDAEGRELHVSRALLSSSSPVFKAMLSPSFQEGKKKSIEISSDYETLKEVLLIVHHYGRDSPDAKLDEESLFSAYMVADKWDFPIVRKKVLEVAARFYYDFHERILETFGSKEENVPCTIPDNFADPWLFSDAEVISRDGKRFHVSKALLSGDYFFRNQFFGQNKSSVEVPIHSSVLQEILHRMHHIYCECSHEIVDQEVLVQLHLSNLFEIPRMDVTPLPPLDAFTKVLDVETDSFIRREQRNTISSICQKLDRSKLFSFLDSEDPRPFFSKADLIKIWKITPKNEKRRKLVDLETEAAFFEIPVNFNKPSGLFNVMIKAKNSHGTQLYAKREVLTKYSKLFKKTFSEPQWSEDKTPEGNDIITVDEEYIILHQIIAVVHGCRNVLSQYLSASFIHAIYQSASEENLDSPLVRKLCRDAVVARNSLHVSSSYLDLFILLKLHQEITLVLDKLRDDDVVQWLEGGAEIQSYVIDEKETVLEVDPNELVFSAQQVQIILASLRRAANRNLCKNQLY